MPASRVGVRARAMLGTRSHPSAKRAACPVDRPACSLGTWTLSRGRRLATRLVCRALVPARVMPDNHGRPTVAEVSLGALRHNCGRVRALVAPGVAVLAVVKADAYGHGAVPAARAFLDAGAWGLGVSSVAEGVELRRAGIDAPIVVLGGTFAGEEADVVAHRLSVAVWDADRARALAAEGRVSVHMKIDTGMTRLGLDLAD